MTVPIVLGDRERWVSVSGVDFGDGTVYALQDVTEEHALEKTRSDFVATASHELRTPLAAVYGAVRTLRRDDVELTEADRAQFLEMIESEATRLAKIVDQILLAGQLDADAVEFEVTECDLEEVAAGVIESAALHLPESISLDLTVDGAAPIRCDENKLRQVLVNLVDNAVKYSPEGGRVELRVRSENGSCLIEVADEGLGHPARRARADLREVLPARPAADPGRRRQRPRPLHLPRAGRAHERPPARRVRARQGLALHGRAAAPALGARRPGRRPREGTRGRGGGVARRAAGARPRASRRTGASRSARRSRSRPRPSSPRSPAPTAPPAVLKLIVPRGGDAAAHEATALRLAGGEGCARLLREDLERGALLLEKLGRSLVRARASAADAGTRSSSPRRSVSGGRRPIRGCPPVRRRRAASLDSSPRCGTSSAALAAGPRSTTRSSARSDGGRRTETIGPSSCTATSTSGTRSKRPTASSWSTRTDCSPSPSTTSASSCGRTRSRATCGSARPGWRSERASTRRPSGNGASSSGSRPACSEPASRCSRSPRQMLDAAERIAG